MNASKHRESLWKGPLADGITFSLLCVFLNCRERFRLKVVEGLTVDEGFNHAIEYGSMWHECEEAHAGGRDYSKALGRYCDRLRANYPGSEGEIRKWQLVCKTQFPIYSNHWSMHPDEVARKPIMEEYAFRVPYALPSGRVVTLRGKFDCVFQAGKAIYLQENKSKGRIDEQGLQETVAQNLQTMIYQTALRDLAYTLTKQASNAVKDPVLTRLHKALRDGATVQGTKYNVIRRPLSDHHAIRQKKDETEAQFYARLGEGIKANLSHYFMRWKILLNNKDVERFQQRTLNPILEQLCDWWESIEADPFNPWETTDYTVSLQSGLVKPKHLNQPKPNKHHYQFPWGVYNSMTGGFRGDFYDLLAKDSKIGLTRIDNLYPELTTYGE